MARDPRKSGAGTLGPTVTSALIVCLAAALALLGQIRLKSDLHRLYTSISGLDRQVAQARRANKKLESDYELITSQVALDHRVRDMRLDLITPGGNARVVLPEPSLQPQAEPHLESRSTVGTPAVSAVPAGREVSTVAANGRGVVAQTVAGRLVGRLPN